MRKIPKKIHYCWFGGNEMSEKELKCIESWKKYMPDYEIIRWDESNFNYKKCKYIEDAYNNKKWAFVSDFARLDIIYNNGGIYLDTDVEVIKSFDDLLDNSLFLGIEDGTYLLNTGLGFGATKGNKILKENMDEYYNLNFYNVDGTFNLVTCPIITTNIIKKYNVTINNKFFKNDYITILPIDYLCPKNYYTEKINITKNTYSIHHCSMSWLSSRDRRWHRFQAFLSKLVGIKLSIIIMVILKTPGSLLISIKNNGFKKTILSYLNKIKK